MIVIHVWVVISCHSFSKSQAGVKDSQLMTHPSKKSWTFGSAAPLFTESCISLYIFFWKSLFFSGKTVPGPIMVPSVKCSERLIVFTGPLTSLCFRQFFLLFLSSLSTPLPFFQSSWSLFPQLPFSLPSSAPLFFFLHASLLFERPLHQL